MVIVEAAVCGREWGEVKALRQIWFRDFFFKILHLRIRNQSGEELPQEEACAHWILQVLGTVTGQSGRFGFLIVSAGSCIRESERIATGRGLRELYYEGARYCDRAVRQVWLPDSLCGILHP